MCSPERLVSRSQWWPLHLPWQRLCQLPEAPQRRQLSQSTSLEVAQTSSSCSNLANPRTGILGRAGKRKHFLEHLVEPIIDTREFFIYILFSQNIRTRIWHRYNGNRSRKCEGLRSVDIGREFWSTRNRGSFLTCPPLPPFLLFHIISPKTPPHAVV